MTDTPEVRARRLVDELTHRGAVSQRMAAALRAVPRHLCIPDTIYRHERGRAGNDLVPVRRGEQPEEWLRLVYADEAVNTQVDDGQPAEDGTGWEVTSSSSQPSVVAGMLDELHAQPGDLVLEIGTGTGWHAALLAHLIGPENVTSVEVDSTIADRARAALDSAGYGKISVITGDGVVGCPGGAPYHQVIATVGVARVPYPWVEQTRSGGRLVVPLTGDYQPPGVVALTAHGDGTASGRLSGPADFMALRAQPGRHRPPVHTVLDDVPAERETTTDVHPWHLAGDRDAATAIGQWVTGVRRVWQPAGPLGTLWLYAAESRSWASLELLDQPPYPVRHAGPRPLFDEVIDAYRWWRDASAPAFDQWLMTVTPERQTITLDR